MLKVDKNDEPEFFTEFKKKSNPKSWKDFDFEIKGKLKEYMLENEQKIDDILGEDDRDLFLVDMDLQVKKGRKNAESR